MAAEPSVNHKLMVSREGLEVMAEAVKALTLREERFQRLSDVITTALETVEPKTAALPKGFGEDPPLGGPIPINLRLAKPLNDELDVFRASLCQRAGDHCGVRETVIYCSMQIAKG